MDKLAALKYITSHNPVCTDCARGNLEQVRKAAGLYQLVKDIIAGQQDSFSPQDLDAHITEATTF